MGTTAIEAEPPKSIARRNSTTGHAGVSPYFDCWHKRVIPGRYMASIGTTLGDGTRRVIGLGVWNSLIEGSIAYNFAAKALRGERARLNPIPEDQAPPPERIREIEARVRWIVEHRYPEVLPLWRRDQAKEQGQHD